ncbi:MAG: hypothetical protein ACTHLO_01980 [Pseudolabrys sp.]
MRLQISERDIAMFTVSPVTRSGLLVLLTVALTTSAYARGGGHGGSNGSNGSQVANRSVHSSTAVVSSQAGKTLAHRSIVLARRHSHPQDDAPVVRDHRGSEDEIGNTVGGPCYGGCVGQGGLGGDTQPAQNQDHSTGSGSSHVTDHRTDH